jgi:hypothetical protein
MKFQGTPNNQNNLEKNKFGCLTLLTFKTYAKYNNQEYGIDIKIDV